MKRGSINGANSSDITHHEAQAQASTELRPTSISLLPKWTMDLHLPTATTSPSPPVGSFDISEYLFPLLIGRSTERRLHRMIQPATIPYPPRVSNLQRREITNKMLLLPIDLQHPGPGKPDHRSLSQPTEVSILAIDSCTAGR